MKLFKLFIVAIIATTVLFACAKAPKKEYDAAQAAVKAAQEKNAEQCAPVEYNKAEAAVEAAERKMEKAKAGEGDKSDLYEQAKADLIAAQEEAKAAEAKAVENRQKSDQINAKLAELKKKIDEMEVNAGNLDEYNKLQMKYERAKELADDCRADEAQAMLEEVEKQAQEVNTIIAAEKAREMK
jgi:chromosome segregation ATPase